MLLPHSFLKLSVRGTSLVFAKPASAYFSSTCKKLDFNPPSFAKSIKLGRPLSPVSIYRPQLTSVLSISFRATGVGLAAAFYALSAVYAVVPFDSSALVTSLYSIPAFMPLATAAISYPFVFHTANGIRHLVCF